MFFFLRLCTFIYIVESMKSNIRKTDSIVIKEERTTEKKISITEYSALSKPDNVTWNLNGYYLEVSWQHSDQLKSIEGYYISLCAWHQKKCGPPDFVHFNKKAMKGRILGLAPDSTYIMKVIVYNANEHISSIPQVINTANLEFLKVKNVTVSQVTSSSAFFQWYHEPYSNIHDTQFKLHCDGMRQYLALNREIIQEKHSFHHLRFSTSSGIEVFLVENISANTKYTCVVSSMAGNLQSPPSHKVVFTTERGGEDVLELWFEKQKPVAHQFAVVMVSCVIIVVILIIIAFLITTYYRPKCQDHKDNYVIVVPSSGSSDEEIYNRTKHTRRHTKMYWKGSSSPSTPKPLLTERSPDMTYAEWAIENMSQSPAFREMVLKHPEALDGIDPVMTRIGERWEEEQKDSGAKGSGCVNADVETHKPQETNSPKRGHHSMSGGIYTRNGSGGGQGKSSFRTPSRPPPPRNPSRSLPPHGFSHPLARVGTRTTRGLPTHSTSHTTPPRVGHYVSRS